MGPDGPIGPDGNTSKGRWISINGNNVSLAAGSFVTGGGFLGTDYTSEAQKELITGIRIAKTDYYPVAQDLEQWLLFCDVGATLYIRGVGTDRVDEISYYEVVYAPFLYNNNNEVYFLVSHIDSNWDALGNPLLTGSDYLDDKEYYIGYINNNTSSTSANAVRYATTGHATTPTSGKFSLTNGGGAGVLYGWQGSFNYSFKSN